MKEEEKMSEKVSFHGKIVGHTKGNKYYTKRNKDNIFRKANSVNISKELVEDLEKDGIERIVITVNLDETELKYSVPIEEIHQFETYSYEGDAQWMLPLQDLKKYQPGQMRVMPLDKFFGKTEVKVMQMATKKENIVGEVN